MSLHSLEIRDFRNIASAKLSLSPTFNVFCGPNGSGKSSILEALHYLGLGRSFRQTAPYQLIRYSAKQLGIFAEIEHSQRLISLGIERLSTGKIFLRVDGSQAASIIDLVSLLPLRLINAQTHQLLESGPGVRRKYLDWGLFYQDEQFLTCWRQFERILKQRNLVLKEKKSKAELESWTDAFIKYSMQLDCLRASYIEAISHEIKAIAAELLTFPPEISYYSGWNKEKMELSETLALHRAEEYKVGYTCFGPHRADFDIRIKDAPAKHFLSRGQQKLMICAIILAQGKLLVQREQPLLYLIDDLPAELDKTSQERLIALLIQQQAQVFITAIEIKDALERGVNNDLYPHAKMFHVKHGAITKD